MSGGGGVSDSLAGISHGEGITSVWTLPGNQRIPSLPALENPVKSSVLLKPQMKPQEHLIK